MKNKTKIIIAVATVAAVGTALIFSAQYGKLKKEKVVLPRNFTITAHTGCEDTEDNSLESIVVGAENGAEIVEFDLNFTTDGEPVLAHDEAEEDSVALDEAFALIAEYESIRVNIDCKKIDNLKAVVACAEKHGILDRIFYTGIEETEVEAVRADTPNVPYFLNMDVKRSKDKEYLKSLVEKVEAVGAIGINMSHKNCSKELVDAFHEKGLLVSIWTVNSELAMLTRLPLGADNITTRHPAKLNELIKEKTS